MATIVYPAGAVREVSGAETPVVRRTPSGAERLAILLLVTFLLIFPKGGIKVAEVPITWGYLLLGIVALSLPLALLRGKASQIRAEYLVLAAAVMPFQAVVWLGLLFNGVIGWGFAVSLLVSFFFVPVVFLLVIGPAIDRMDRSFLYKLIRGGMLFIAAYGIFLFFYRLSTGAFFEIPYLTVNAGDFGELDSKFIDRGGIFKLISTYNNGNIYGVSILMLLPLHAWIERRRLPVWIVKISLFLTLSRTVWLGLFLYEVLYRTYIKPLRLRTIATLTASMFVVVAGVWGALQLMGANVDFLLDRNLGGRVDQLDSLVAATLLPTQSFEHILEMVYLSILDNFGVLGLLSYLLAMTAPLILHFLRVLPGSHGSYKRHVASGLIVYLFVSLSDGALLFIPVMAFYWFIVSLLVAEPDDGERAQTVGIATT